SFPPRRNFPGGGSGTTGNLAGRHRAQGAAPYGPQDPHHHRPHDSTDRGEGRDGPVAQRATRRAPAPARPPGDLGAAPRPRAAGARGDPRRRHPRHGRARLRRPPGRTPRAPGGHRPRPAEHRHLPVLLETWVRPLAPALQEPGAIHVDATRGMGGHASAVLRAAPHARLVGIDRDPQALELARERLHRDGVGERATLVHATYDRIPEVLEDLGLPGAHAVMMDLGLSSSQIDTPDRGFSYAVDAPLDMRMDPSSDGPTAADLLRELPEAELARILRDLGDERFAKRIARRLVAQRQQAPLTRSGELVELL